MIFICYPKCSTCKKAQKLLDDSNIKYELRDIKLNNPKKEELRKYITDNNLDIKKLFNTSGIKYKELNLKDKLNDLSFEEKLDILSSDGMLVKRPLLIMDNNKILIGFKENEYKENLNI